jgi:hypothetical protein
MLVLFAVMLTACSNTTSSAAKSSTSTTTQGPTATQPPTTTTTTVGNDLTGIGATVANFSKAHGADRGSNGGFCSAANSCFGPPVRNDESGSTYLFTDVDVGGGLIAGYQQNFVPNTTLGEAESEILQYMPADATMSAVTVDKDNSGNSCGLFNITSPTLAAIFSPPAIGDPQGIIGVELEYTNANLNITYDPNNIQDAGLSPLPVNPSDSC